MKFKIEIGGTSVLLDYKQVNALSKVLDSAERLEDKYIGSNQGTNGSSYLKLLRPYQPSETLRITVMSDDEYGALQLVTKLEDEKK